MMRNGLNQLIRENPFNDLAIQPSASPREIRRHLEDLRMQSALGLSPIALPTIEVGEQALRSDLDSYEFRLLALWGQDSLLQGWSTDHDRMVGELSRVIAAPVLNPIALGEILSRWVVLHQGPLLAEMIGRFLPQGISVGRSAADICGAVVLSVFDRSGTLVTGDGFANVCRLLGKASEPFVRGVVDTLCLAVGSLASANADEPPAASATGPRNPDDVRNAFIEATSLAVVVQQELKSFDESPTQWERELGLLLGSRFKSAAIATSTTLFNAGHLSAAASVDSVTLALDLTPADEEELRGDLQVVHLTEARMNVQTALSRSDLSSARGSLLFIESTASDPTERATARQMIARIDARGSRGEGVSGRVKGWGITAAIVIIIAILRVMSAEQESTPSPRISSTPTSQGSGISGGTTGGGGATNNTSAGGGTSSGGAAARAKSELERTRRDLEERATRLSASRARLETQKAGLESIQRRYPNGAPNTVVAQYQRDLAAFNADVDAHNRELAQYQADEEDFNRKVDAYNRTYGGR